MGSSIPPPPYSTVVQSSTQPPPYSSQCSIVPSIIFYPSQAQTFQIVQPSPTIQLQLITPPHPQILFFPPLTSGSNTTLFIFPPFAPNKAPRIFQIPPPFPPYIPGLVPSWVPREIRYEIHRGVLKPVEHFASPTTPLSQGWNTMHGYDTGPLPPGVGTGGDSVTDMARSLDHIAASTVSGRSVQQRGSAAGEGAASGQGLGAGGAENGDGGSKTSSSERETEAGASEEAQCAPESPPGGGGKALGRITRSEMDRNLSEIEAADRV